MPYMTAPRMTTYKLDIDSINRREIVRRLLALDGTAADPAHIGRIFSPNHSHRPSLGLARKIAHVLDVTTDDLCDFLDQLKAA